MKGRDKQNEKLQLTKYLDVEFRSTVSGTSAAAPKFVSRQWQILKLVAEGYTSREIALQLHVSEATVRTYRAKLRRDARNKVAQISSQTTTTHRIGWFRVNVARPPINAEYLLHLLLRKDERDVVIGDLIEDYGNVLERFGKRRADIWFYKQVSGSLIPLIRRQLLRVGALVWLGRILHRLIS